MSPLLVLASKLLGGGDTDDVVPYAIFRKATRAQHEVENSRPRHRHEFQRKAARDVRIRDEVELADFGEKTAFFFADDASIEFDPKAVKKVLNKEGALDRLREALTKMEQLEDWTAGAIDQMIHLLSTEAEVGMGKYAQPIRVAVTGTMVSPGIGETLEVLGRQRTLARIRRTLDMFAGTGEEHE